jgi:Domain of unknown function (DUF4188)
MSVDGSRIHRGRWTDDAPEGSVAFLIGMRINRLTAPHRWVPVLMAMPRMLIELQRASDLGLLSARTFVGGRVIMTLQYWRDADALQAYAAAGDHLHLPAWRTFNRAARASSAVGVWHETYVVGAANHEAVYVNMPSFGLAAATSLVPVAKRGDSAAHRLDPQRPDLPVEAG